MLSLPLKGRKLTSENAWHNSPFKTKIRIYRTLSKYFGLPFLKSFDLRLQVFGDLEKFVLLPQCGLVLSLYRERR